MAFSTPPAEHLGTTQKVEALKIGPFVMDEETQSVLAEDRSIRFDKLHFALLVLVAKQPPGVPIRKTDLYEGLWPNGRRTKHNRAYTDKPAAKGIDVLICQIRERFRLEGVPNYIGTAWGTGYFPSDTPVPAKHSGPRRRTTFEERVARGATAPPDEVPPRT